MIRSGLCSVTFRQLEPARVVALTAAAGLEAIEWGGDVHVPAGDVARAAEVARQTADAGLAVASYGSYFRATEGEEIAPVLDAAEALGADRIRVWAGRVGSADASDAQRRATAERLRAAASDAAARGIALALEFHGGTLTDSAASTRRLLAAVDHPALTTYWQPRVDAQDDDALADYAALSDRVSAAHVFSWSPAGERLPLAARDALWRRFFTAASAAGNPPRDALIEFVPDEDPAVLGREAATLRSWIDAASRLGA